MKCHSSLLILLLGQPFNLWAASDDGEKDPWQFCPTSNIQQRYQSPPLFSDEEKGQTRISAQQVENTAGNITIFSGNVLIERDGIRLLANSASFDKPNQVLELEGDIHIDVNNMAIEATSGWLDLDSSDGEFNDSSYFINDTHLLGKAPKFGVSNESQTLLVDSMFSTCPEQQLDWHLNTGTLLLDYDKQVGTATNTVLWFKSVPIFYTPYISFPLGDERRSGFLMPGFGSSSSSGFEMSIPWYWNIAPNQDAIITPQYLRKRGTLLATNYRYLTQSSRGNIDAEYIDNDQLLDMERYSVKFSNHSDIGKNTDLDILVNDVSDNDYLDDLGSNISISNTTHLERLARLQHHYDVWRFAMTAQSFETIDDTIATIDRPYRRVPQITLNGTDEIFNTPIMLSLDSEWVSFDHDSDLKDTGERFYAYPKLSWPLQGNAWFITPAIGLSHTQYRVTDANDVELAIDDRNLTISSLDAGLFFERKFNDNKLIQTLEPRLFYLNVPYEDQSNIPLFDTGDSDFSFAQLFRDNRFNGIDRIGDTEQLTLAVTSRIIDQYSGNEFMSVSLGQIFYNRDRQVSIDNTVSTENQSDMVAEFNGRMNNWSGRVSTMWNTQTDRSDKHSVQVHYQRNNNRIANFAYRFDRDPVDASNNLEQTDVSFSWPLSHAYGMVGRWNYSITEERDIETLFGIEYQSCCWAIRLVSQRYLTDDAVEPYDSSIMIQMILKGLGSVHGKKTSETLKQAILGYQPEY